jgi:hypothetical protein
MKNHLLACSALLLVFGLSPALAAQSQSGQLPTTPGVSSEAAKSAQQPQSGNPDMSGGAAEQSSASPNSGAASNSTMNQSMNSTQGQDQSGGAKEQSSASPGSSAATNQPNPTLGQQSNPHPKTQSD